MVNFCRYWSFFIGKNNQKWKKEKKKKKRFIKIWFPSMEKHHQLPNMHSRAESTLAREWWVVTQFQRPDSGPSYFFSHTYLAQNATLPWDPMGSMHPSDPVIWFELSGLYRLTKGQRYKVTVFLIVKSRKKSCIMISFTFFCNQIDQSLLWQIQ